MKRDDFRRSRCGGAGPHVVEHMGIFCGGAGLHTPQKEGTKNRKTVFRGYCSRTLFEGMFLGFVVAFFNTEEEERRVVFWHECWFFAETE